MWRATPRGPHLMSVMNGQKIYCIWTWQVRLPTLIIVTRILWVNSSHRSEPTSHLTSEYTSDHYDAEDVAFPPTSVEYCTHTE